MTLKIGSLCTGVGALDMAVRSVLDADITWHCQYEPPDKKGREQPQHAARILEHHWPEVPNHGDITKVDWDQAEPVDGIVTGFPCTDVSIAGGYEGMTATNRSGLWHENVRAIRALNPKMVVIENVRGLLSADAHGCVEPCPWCVGETHRGPALRALGAVLGDLAGLGFHAEWVSADASAAGAPHGRRRVFILAWRPEAAADLDGAAREERRPAGSSEAESGWPRGDAGGRPGEGLGGLKLLPTLTARDWRSGASNLLDQGGRPLNEVIVEQLAPVEGWVATDGADYGPAIARWERVLGRAAPNRVVRGPRGGLVLDPRFGEWFMGFPDGHVTAVPGIPRAAQIHALGNAVVPQQVSMALRFLWRYLTGAVS